MIATARTLCLFARWVILHVVADRLGGTPSQFHMSTKHLFCCFLLLTLSTAVLAQDSLTARIPVAIAAGEYSEAEVLLTEAVKTGLISAAAAAAYQRDIQQGRARSAAAHASKQQQPLGTDPEPEKNPHPSQQEKPTPDWIPSSDSDRDPQRKQGRIYVTYTRFNTKTQRYYSGRTSMVIDLDKPLRLQAEHAVDKRNSNHHLDENDEPSDPAFRPADVDQFDVGTAINYENRYRDIAYLRIRGREQQLIDSHGGAQSDTRKKGEPDRTENAIRAVARDHKQGGQFHEAATAKWGMMAPYTGD